MNLSLQSSSHYVVIGLPLIRMTRRNSYDSLAAMRSRGRTSSILGSGTRQLGSCMSDQDDRGHGGTTPATGWDLWNTSSGARI